MSARANTVMANAALVAALCCAPGAEAAPLGRLFFSPDERAALEYRRQLAGKAQSGNAKLTLNGLVWRSAGRSTIWINGQPLYQKAEQMGLGEDRRDPSQVDLRLTGRRPLRLRVGEPAR